MKFCVTDYSKSDRVVMHCPTEESAEIFCKYLDLNGKTYRSGSRYTERNCWGYYGEQTCYFFTEGTYQDLPYFEKTDSMVLEFYDFDWSEFGIASPAPIHEMSFEEMFYGNK